MRLLALLVPMIAFMVPPPAYAQAQGETVLPGGVRVRPAVALTLTSSPLGSVAIPEGWTLRTVQGGMAFLITPRGQRAPVIFILPTLRLSDFRYTSMITRCGVQFNPLGDVLTTCVIPSIRTQIADSSHPWSARDALQVLGHILAGPGARFSPTEVVAHSVADATYAIPVHLANGTQIEDWGYVHMIYVQNPLLSQPSGQPGVTSLAFLSGCEALSGQVESFRPLCAGVLQSIRLNQAFASELVQQLAQLYNEEYQILLKMGWARVRSLGIREQMIANFGANMRQMQYQMFQNLQTANLHNGENWIRTFGNEEVRRDLGTGKRYIVDRGYSSYCLDAAGNLLEGNNLVPGRYFGNPGYRCETVLQP